MHIQARYSMFWVWAACLVGVTRLPTRMGTSTYWRMVAAFGTGRMSRQRLSAARRTDRLTAKRGFRPAAVLLVRSINIYHRYAPRPDIAQWRIALLGVCCRRGGLSMTPLAKDGWDTLLRERFDLRYAYVPRGRAY